MRLGDLVVRFVADMGGWNTGVKQAQKDMDDTGKTASKMDTSVKQAGADLLIMAGAAAAAGYACYSASMKYGEMADEIKDLSYQTGIGTEKIQQLQYAALISGTNFGVVSQGINKLTLSMDEAKDPASAAYKAFMGIGVDPSGKTPEEVFDATAKALVGMKDESLRNSYAMDLYGRSYKELLPYMADYIKNADEIKKAPVYTQKELDDLVDAKVSWDKLTNSFTIYSGKVLAFVDSVQSKQAAWTMAFNPVAKFLFGSKTAPEGGAGGRAGTDAGPVSQEPVTKAPLVDKYAGLSEEGLKYQSSLDAITSAQNEYNIALTGTQDDLDKAAKRLREVQLSHEALRLEMAKTHSEDQIAALEGLQQALKDVGDEQTRLANLNRDYLEDVKYAGADVSQIRRITMAHQRDLRNEDTTMSGLKQKLSDSASAAGYGDLIINIDGKQLVKVQGVISGELNRQSATARGVRTAS